jgi:hypothetical protein
MQSAIDPSATSQPEAGTAGDGSSTDEASGGATTDAIHGIEPKLVLSYDSGRRNAIAGVGWKLLGLSQIERTSPRLGAPRFDAADIYMLDGEELIACTTAMVSRSCDTGGNYVTRVES